MNRRKLSIVIAAFVIFGLLVIGMVNRHSTAQQIHPTNYPPVKLTIEARETEEMLTAQAMATERVKQYGTKSSYDGAPPKSCPRTTPQPTQPVVIADYRQGPTWGAHIINTAQVLSSAGDYYWVFAGAPGYGTVSSPGAPDQGLIRVMYRGSKASWELMDTDPCVYYWVKESTPRAARRSTNDFVDYLFPKGPLTLTKIDGDTVIFSIAGGGTGRFNYVTGEFLP